MKKYFFILTTTILLIVSSCTKLDEKLNGQLNPATGGAGNVNIDALLNGAYNTMRDNFQGQGNLYALGSPPESCRG